MIRLEMTTKIRPTLLRTLLVFRVTFTEEEEADDNEEGGGVLVELEGKDEKRERETNLWFSKVCPTTQFIK